MTQAARHLPAHRCAMLPGGRLHLNEGPIDLIIGAEGGAAAVRAAYAKAERRFEGLLAELVAELPALRAPDGEACGAVARRMLAAVRPHRAVFVTPMAAVAGAVADEVLAAMVSTPGLAKAYVNNGGDIAVHLTLGERLTVGAASGGVVTLTAGDDVRGIATSGAGGRSMSLGIADAVTVLACDAAAADVAATLIGNAVDLDHRAIERAPATELDPDSDLGERLVTVRIGELPPEAASSALANACTVARAMRSRGLIAGVLLRCQGQVRGVGPMYKIRSRP